MLNIHTLTLGAYGTNCYIVHDSASKTCCVIDPGYTPLEKKQLLSEKEYREMRERYEDEFRAAMGAEAIKERAGADRGSDPADPRTF